MGKSRAAGARGTIGGRQIDGQRTEGDKRKERKEDGSVAA